MKSVQFANLQRCDRMSMAHSLEARVPFFDVDYISTAMAVNPAKKLIYKVSFCIEGRNIVIIHNEPIHMADAM